MATIRTKLPAATSQKDSCPVAAVAAGAAASATTTTKSSAAKAKKARSKQQKKTQVPTPAAPKVDPLALAISQDLLIRLQISSKPDGDTTAGAVAPATNGSDPEAGCSPTATATATAAVCVSAARCADAGTCKGPGAEPAGAAAAGAAGAVTPADITYVIYENELQMPDIMRLIQKDLSEPYSIYTYRYFIHNWPKLCYLAMHGDRCIGAIVCKLDMHRQSIKRGYIAMLAVDQDYRKLKIGTRLVQSAIQAMLLYDAHEVVLETEITNTPALRLYENLGFVRDKRLFGYYLNGVDALRLKLWFR